MQIFRGREQQSFSPAAPVRWHHHGFSSRSGDPQTFTPSQPVRDSHQLSAAAAPRPTAVPALQSSASSSGHFNRHILPPPSADESSRKDHDTIDLSQLRPIDGGSVVPSKKPRLKVVTENSIDRFDAFGDYDYIDLEAELKPRPPTTTTTTRYQRRRPPLRRRPSGPFQPIAQTKQFRHQTVHGHRLRNTLRRGDFGPQFPVGTHLLI